MTKEEAIKILDPETTAEALTEIEYYGGFHGKEAKIAAVNEACGLAVEALREQIEQEKNEPLTLDELREMKGEPVYLVSALEHDENGWVIIDSYGTDINGCGYFLTSDGLHKEDAYVRGLVKAYRRKLEENP